MKDGNGGKDFYVLVLTKPKPNGMGRFYTKLFLVLFMSIFCLISYSQETKPVTELDPVTVTASLYPGSVSKTGRNIIIVKGEEFSKLPVHSIDELLRYLPGIEIQQRGPMGSQADIVIRGGTFQQVLVILDGIRLNDPNTGHFNAYIPIAPAEIDRIEILKGASSAIYGSDAVGGVVHIITKTFSAMNNTSRKQYLAVATAGEYELIHTNAGLYFQNKKTAIGAGVLSANSKGQLQRGTRGYFHNNTASVSLSRYFNSDWQLSLRTAYDKRKFSAQNFYTTFISDTARETVTTFWNQLHLAYTKRQDKFSLDGGYKRTRDEYGFNSGLPPNKNKSTLVQMLAIYQHSFNARTVLITGAQFQKNGIRSNDRGDHELKQAAFFVIVNQNMGRYFFISPALRLDWSEGGGTEMIPQANLSYKKERIQLRGSIGKTIRQANFTERFNNYNKALVTSGSIGNPDLKAETSLSYEAGADYFAVKNFKLSLSLFRREQEDVIDWSNTPYSDMPRKDNLSPTGNYALASNIAAVNISGIETDIQYSKAFARRHQVWGTLGLVWLHTKTDQPVPSFYISSNAKFLANFNALYSNKIFAVTLNGVYKHRRPQFASAINAKVDKNSFIANAQFELFLLQQRLTLFLEVDNIANKNTQDLLGSQLPGRWSMGGIKLRL